jgi:hypothetical protein
MAMLAGFRSAPNPFKGGTSIPDPQEALSMADHSVIRLVPLACLGALALSGCHKPSASNTASPAAAPFAAATGTPAGSATALPTRKAGFWVETMTRDGKFGPMGGSVKMCIDAATDAKFSTFGRQMGKSACHQQSITRGLDGSYHFATTCTIGAAGTLVSNGTATGDFSSKYVIHDESTISGAPVAEMNGRHVTEITATYQGPCPPDMVPGDVQMGEGMKVNINRLPQAGQAKAP